MAEREFREQWADFYVMQKNGVDAEFLATAKAQLVADQKSVLEPRRDEACQELRESCDIRYRELLDDQKEMRAELRWRRDAGLDATPFLNEMEERRQAGQEIRTEFRETGRELLDVNRWPISKPVGSKRPKMMMRPLWGLTSTFISAAGSATPSWRLPTPYFVIWLISVPHRRNRGQMRRGRTCSVRRLRTPLSSISGTSARRKTPVHASDSGFRRMTAGPGQPRPRPLLIRHMKWTDHWMKATPRKSRLRLSPNARLQARACFPDAGERLGGAGRVNGPVRP